MAFERSMTAFSFGFGFFGPVRAPDGSVDQLSTDQPGNLVQGPEEKFGSWGFVVGLATGAFLRR